MLKPRAPFVAAESGVCADRRFHGSAFYLTEHQDRRAGWIRNRAATSPTDAGQDLRDRDCGRNVSAVFPSGAGGFFGGCAGVTSRRFYCSTLPIVDNSKRSTTVVRQSCRWVSRHASIGLWTVLAARHRRPSVFTPLLRNAVQPTAAGGNRGLATALQRRMLVRRHMSLDACPAHPVIST